MAIDYQNRQLFSGHKTDRRTRALHRKMRVEIDRFNQAVSNGDSLKENSGSIHFDDITSLYVVSFEKKFPVEGRIASFSDMSYIYFRDYTGIYEDLASRGISRFCVEGIKATLLRDYDLITGLGKSRCQVSRGKLFGILILDRNHRLDTLPEKCHIDITSEDVKIKINGKNCCNDWRYHGKIFEVVKKIAEIDG